MKWAMTHGSFDSTRSCAKFHRCRWAARAARTVKKKTRHSRVHHDCETQSNRKKRMTISELRPNYRLFCILYWRFTLRIHSHPASRLWTLRLAGLVVRVYVCVCVFFSPVVVCLPTRYTAVKIGMCQMCSQWFNAFSLGLRELDGLAWI